MRNYEYVKGTLTPVTDPNKLLKEVMAGNDSFDNYQLIDGTYYSMEKKHLEDKYIYNAFCGQGGVITFELRYDSQGCDFISALKEALTRTDS